MPATQLLALYRGKQLSPVEVIEHTMPIPAAYADPRADDLPRPSNACNWVTYTYVFNLTKNLSCSIPCGFADGLPIGLMVTSPLLRGSRCAARVSGV
jgi:Asp-tRNA(Asn)/Glu-tRNA(Gln) amidotransferase A subunit family amidase